jgi:aryl-alcohol dehydrogenase-like predicted oxidoreductase
MKYKILGNTGLKVSELCLGAMTFGGEGVFKHVGNLNQEQAIALVRQAMEAGINFIDTANIYSAGQSEGMLGQDPYRSAGGPGFGSTGNQSEKPDG